MCVCVCWCVYRTNQISLLTLLAVRVGVCGCGCVCVVVGVCGWVLVCVVVGVYGWVLVCLEDSSELTTDTLTTGLHFLLCVTQRVQKVVWQIVTQYRPEYILPVPCVKVSGTTSRLASFQTRPFHSFFIHSFIHSFILFNNTLDMRIDR